MATTYNPRIVTDGLVLCLDAGNTKSYPGSGTTWTDLSGQGNNGTLAINNPTFSNTNGGIFSFNGLNNFMRLPSSLYWTPSGGGYNTLTFELWVKSADTSGQYLSKPWNGNGEYNYWVTYNSWYTRINTQSHSLAFTSLATNTWQHGVFIITPTQKAVYRNGRLNADFTNHSITGNTPGSGNLNVSLSLMTLYPYTGAWAGDTTHAILGDAARIAVYNRVLSADEISQNFNALRGRFGV